MAGIPGSDPIFQSKHQAVSVLFPYALRLAQDGQQGMINAILHIATKSTSGGFMWCPIEPYITALFDESSPASLNWAIILASPCADWIEGSYTRNTVVRWAAAVLATPYSEEVGRSVVDVLLQITCNDSLRPHIPIDIWVWLKRRPSLPPLCRGRYLGSAPRAVHYIRRLGDIEILKSYFLLVWSEWDILCAPGIVAMETTIREDFCGLAMRGHREDLAERLDRIRGKLDQGLGYFTEYQPWVDEYDIEERKAQYRGLEKVLLDVDRSAMEALPGALLKLIPFDKLTNYCVQALRRVYNFNTHEH